MSPAWGYGHLDDYSLTSGLSGPSVHTGACQGNILPFLQHLRMLSMGKEDNTIINILKIDFILHSFSDSH